MSSTDLYCTTVNLFVRYLTLQAKIVHDIRLYANVTLLAFPVIIIIVRNVDGKLTKKGIYMVSVVCEKLRMQVIN